MTRTGSASPGVSATWSVSPTLYWVNPCFCTSISMKLNFILGEKLQTGGTLMIICARCWCFEWQTRRWWCLDWQNRRYWCFYWQIRSSGTTAFLKYSFAKVVILTITTSAIVSILKAIFCKEPKYILEWGLSKLRLYFSTWKVRCCQVNFTPQTYQDTTQIIQEAY